MKVKDQFDEISSPEALREECRSLLSQIKLHQKQIIELHSMLEQNYKNQQSLMEVLAEKNSVKQK